MEIFVHNAILIIAYELLKWLINVVWPWIRKQMAQHKENTALMYRVVEVDSNYGSYTTVPNPHTKYAPQQYLGWINGWCPCMKIVGYYYGPMHRIITFDTRQEAEAFIKEKQ